MKWMMILAAFGLFSACADGADSNTIELGHDEPMDYLFAEQADQASDASGKADRASHPFYLNLVVWDAMFLDAHGLISADDIQAFLEETPYGGRSWLADEEIDGVLFSTHLYEAASDNGISPLVLLSRAQIEASLVSRTTRPRDSLVDRAFGCGCHDGQACFDRFLGLDKQLKCSAETFAKLYRRSVDGTGQWKKGVPRTTLDDHRVTPKSHATAAYYAYTPWAKPNTGGNWLIRGITLKYARHLGVNEGFSGTECSASADCHFDQADEHGFCISDTFFSLKPSQCTAQCEGLCGDMPGAAPTFCAQFDFNDHVVGMCMPKPSAVNDNCAALPDSKEMQAQRFVGDSGVSTASARVCVPATLADTLAAE